ncbi:putative bifunctional diguanylate cyclase/phosphodiesterase [Altericroceibacterium xinjiangense]|uniref:putative bifunctional diguanylate cyclase/phosphodiesterase n=1 Tax=Altericroceibacterium xinjiangense TaxID=762261 RepID=UPI000F7E0FE6|nr:EAL domain-containing protein [Altericroceibacterium xinjiangense]
MNSLLRQQEVLAKFGELALRSDSLDEILTEACRLVGEALGTDLAKVMELSEDGISLLVRAGVGWADGVVGKATAKAVKGSSEGYALQTGQPVVSPDIEAETRFEYADFIKNNGVKAIANVIILGADGERPFGLLQVDSREPRHFSASDTRFLRGYANLIAAAVNRLQVSERMRFAATYDATTSLPNRVSFRNEVEKSLEQARKTHSSLSLLLVDLDRFKQINDVLGHQVGDAALYAFGRRMEATLPGNAMVARLGGDEFVAMLPGADSAAAGHHAEHVLKALAAPFSAEGRNVDLRASIGISTFPADGTGSTQLLGSADLALYAAKKAGGGQAYAYEPTLRADQQGQLAMLRHARTALKNNWVVPFYQPQVALATGEVRGFEALLRWHHPRAGLQYPASIAYAFDDPSTAGVLGSTIADAALSDVNRWIDAGLTIGKMGINVSAAEFRDPSYADKLLQRITLRGLAPALLEIEITETAFLDADVRHVIKGLDLLRSAGVTVALDDFGTGFSSLSHLRDLPVDTIKIDGSFVHGLDKRSKDRSIIEAVLTLGNALGMTTIAECVETQAQADFLKARGCAFAQGFLFAPALDALRAKAHLVHNTSLR